MALEAGKKLGSYEILSPLGAGGMGEVYLANDSKLDRNVAIKVLPELMTRDKERVARFEREAKLLASLNHPNIAAIHGFDDAEGTRFLVMEYVEGETLGNHLKHCPVAVEDALDIAKQIAEGLEAAHEQGVIHRDLKPANVMIREDRTVKVLDFGLAKAMIDEPSGGADANSPTITANYTRPGVVLGTAAYMSPEQARGRSLDKRTDIWSFGCVFYELLTGKRTFDGQTASDVLAQILERDPDMSALPPNTPPKIIDLVRRCLEKSTGRRLRDIGDAVLELDEAISARSWTTSAIMAASGPMYAGSKRTTMITWGLLIALGAAIGWLGTSLVNKDVASTTTNTQDRRVMRMSITIPEFIQPDSIKISPTGGLFAAIGDVDARGSVAKSTQVFTRLFDDNVFRPVSGTSGAIHFCFSPDGKWLAFTTHADRLEDGYELSKVAVDGSSPPLHLATVALKWQTGTGSLAGFSWNRQNEVLMVDGATTAKAILRISAQTGDANIIDLAEIATNVYMGPFSHIPNRDVTVYNVDKYTGGVWQMTVRALVPGESQLQMLAEDGSSGTVTSTGHLLYTRGQRLLATRFDTERLQTIGGPVAMVDGLRTRQTWDNGAYGLSDDGTLIFLPGGRVGTQRHLTIVDSDEKLTDVVHPGRAMEISANASRDGKLAAVVIANSAGLYELWVTEFDVPRLRRLAAETDGDCGLPLWSRDGKYLYYTFSGKIKRDGIYRRRTDGTGDAEKVFLAPRQLGALLPRALSPDDSLLIVEKSSSGSNSLYVLRIDDEGGQQGLLEPLLGDSFDTDGADLSFDGKWLVYGSNESGRSELYIRSFSVDGSLGKAIPATTQGGGRPRWSPDGKLIYYRKSTELMVMDIDTTEGRPTSAPRVAVDLESKLLIADDFATLPGGKLLMIHKGPEEAKPTHVEVILNWFEELKAKVPVGAKQ
jgi:eukaryotic-like serine/threonine-protein kinase